MVKKRPARLFQSRPNLDGCTLYLHFAVQRLGPTIPTPKKNPSGNTSRTPLLPAPTDGGRELPVKGVLFNFLVQFAQNTSG